MWEVRIQYANGNEKILRACTNRETALRYVDAIYSQGYPMHVAYLVRPRSVDGQVFVPA
ncbi:family 2 glycosyl transferase [Funiculus sociatus]|nr:family 2 glycosyl transferase [Trichocoleus sp. FACHB-69]